MCLVGALLKSSYSCPHANFWLNYAIFSIIPMPQPTVQGSPTLFKEGHFQNLVVNIGSLSYTRVCW